MISDRVIESFGDEIIICQNLKNNEHGASVWDSSLVLAKFFENPLVKSTFKNKKILELGAGNGFISIVLLKLGAKQVISTDRECLLQLIRENCQRNLGKSQLEKLNVVPFLWGEENDIHQQSLYEDIDIIVASDCIYDKIDLWKPLLKTFLDLTSTRGIDEHPPTIVLSYELRSKEDAAFFKEAKLYFDINKVKSSDLDPLWQSPDIGIFYLRRKINSA